MIIGLFLKYSTMPKRITCVERFTLVHFNGNVVVGGHFGFSRMTFITLTKQALSYLFPLFYLVNLKLLRSCLLLLLFCSF